MWLEATPNALTAFFQARERMEALIEQISAEGDLSRHGSAGEEHKGFEKEVPRVDQYFCAGPNCGPKAATRDGKVSMEIKNLQGVSKQGSESWEKATGVDISAYTKLPWVSLQKTRNRCKAKKAVKGTRLEGLKALEITEIDVVDDCIWNESGGTPQATGGQMPLKYRKYLTVAVEGLPAIIEAAVIELELGKLALYSLGNEDGAGLYGQNVSYPRFISIASTNDVLNESSSAEDSMNDVVTAVGQPAVSVQEDSDMRMVSGMTDLDGPSEQVVEQERNSYAGLHTQLVEQVVVPPYPVSAAVPVQAPWSSTTSLGAPVEQVVVQKRPATSSTDTPYSGQKVTTGRVIMTTRPGTLPKTSSFIAGPSSSYSSRRAASPSITYHSAGVPGYQGSRTSRGVTLADHRLGAVGSSYTQRLGATRSVVQQAPGQSRVIAPFVGGPRATSPAPLGYPSQSYPLFSSAATRMMRSPSPTALTSTYRPTAIASYAAPPSTLGPIASYAAPPSMSDGIAGARRSITVQAPMLQTLPPSTPTTPKGLGTLGGFSFARSAMTYQMPMAMGSSGVDPLSGSIKAMGLSGMDVNSATSPRLPSSYVSAPSQYAAPPAMSPSSTGVFGFPTGQSLSYVAGGSASFSVRSPTFQTPAFQSSWMSPSSGSAPLAMSPSVHLR